MPDYEPFAVPPFEVRVDEDGGTVTLSFSGELDLATAATTQEDLERALRDGAAQVVVDLTDLTFIDSTGIALFVLAKREYGDGRLRFLPSKSSAVRRVLAITGLDETFGLAKGSENGRDPS
jgi:anti-sigma B factor antagonist